MTDKMKELFKKLGARIIQVEVEYSRKMSDGDYGSVGGMFRVTAEVAQGSDPVTAIDGLYAWVKERAVENMRESFEKVTKTPTQLHVPKKEEVKYKGVIEEIPFIEGKEPIQIAGETRIPLDDSGNEVCLMNVESIEVEYTPGGEKRAKVRGKTQDHPSETWPYKGNYTKFGVVAYPEVLKEIDFDLDAKDAAKYVMQPGYTAVVQIVGDKPKKITGFV